jgi:hypothetical protein
MDEVELIYEISDRHSGHLIYDGEYRLTPLLAEERRTPLETLFEDWRQRIYRFENDLGASVVFYRPLTRSRMTWDLVVARFIGRDPFDFRYAAGVRSNLRWREVQRLLDDIKTK